MFIDKIVRMHCESISVHPFYVGIILFVVFKMMAVLYVDVDFRSRHERFAGSPGAWPAPAPSPSSRFSPSVEVKERLHLPAFQRLSGLTKALPLFYLLVATAPAGSPLALHSRRSLRAWSSNQPAQNQHCPLTQPNDRK
ncbi:hypothetical protein SAMN05192533_110149 [Mesobacillus persicus]|uniref:Uncharacterized protein n=1 Tax=Mesobacillus persicus TaxID=930146 RepID=A0A1H8EYE5_9BACI|nr:hypothetical protein SAMN05192533_110149 [Mesobacillus persicus]